MVKWLKDPELPQLQLGFNFWPWPRNFYVPQMWPLKKKKGRKPTQIAEPHPRAFELVDVRWKPRSAVLLNSQVIPILVLRPQLRNTALEQVPFHVLKRTDPGVP